MKKIIVAIVIALSLIGCGNIDTFDANSICYILAKWPDGTMKKIEVKEWHYYTTGQVKIISPNGTLYILSIDNTVLVLEPGK